MLAAVGERLTLHRLSSGERKADFAADVRRGLLSRPKSLPPKYFYDRLGSFLFEAICELPEYYVTRAESEILEASAGEMAAALEPPLRLIELGSGSSTKTRLLIEAILDRQEALEYLPIDISRAVLEESAYSLLERYPPLTVRAVSADYERALEFIAAGDREADPGPAGRHRTLAIFLGSSIGNLDEPQAVSLLRKIRAVLQPGDGLLLGADLKKSEEILVPAYDDALGVTAAFNLNVLGRINRELGGEFDLRKFEHRALFNPEQSRIELHAVSRERQTIPVRGLGLTVEFEEGESIHTENSYKYSREQLAELARAGGLELNRTWHDEGHRFSVNLLTA